VKGGIELLKPVEEMIRKLLENGLQQFDDYCGKNQDAVNGNKEKLRSITAKVVIEKTVDDSDLLVYSPQRPLQFKDFAGKPEPLNQAAAITHSGILISYDSETRDGQASIHVRITPYFDKAKSWFRNSSNGNVKVLLHEQKHFDITASKACELVEALQHYQFTDNYARELDQLYKLKQKECDQLQEEYDAQTKHGQVANAQQKWNGLIQEALSKRNCFQAGN